RTARSSGSAGERAVSICAGFGCPLGHDGAKMRAAVKVFVLGSGSSGNCLLLEAEGERLVIDAGMGPNRAVERMRALGEDLITSRAPLGLFVTHDHGDHASHALPLARA